MVLTGEQLLVDEQPETIFEAEALVVGVLTLLEQSGRHGGQTQSSEPLMVLTKCAKSQFLAIQADLCAAGGEIGLVKG